MTDQGLCVRNIYIFPHFRRMEDEDSSDDEGNNFYTPEGVDYVMLLVIRSHVN